jgi:hypothetical protein
MFGAPWGAFFGMYGVQSGVESRTSSLITPLNGIALLEKNSLTGCCLTSFVDKKNASTNQKLPFNRLLQLKINLCVSITATTKMPLNT